MKRFPRKTVEKLHKWQGENFPDSTKEHMALGIVEEIGELCHAVLKREQGIRSGIDVEKSSALIDDALGDISIFAINMEGIPEIGPASIAARLEPVLRMAHQLIFAISNGSSPTPVNMTRLFNAVSDFTASEGGDYIRIVDQTARGVIQRNWLKDKESGGE